MQVKIKILSFLFILAFCALVVRLCYWQIVRAKYLSREAKNQYASSKVVSAPRGNILAPDGSFWVVRSESYTVFANTTQIKDTPKVIADKLAPFFVKNNSDRVSLLTEIGRLETLLEKKNAFFLPLMQKVTSEEKKEIEKMGIEGIGFQPEEIRFYPEASTAAQLIGFVGKDKNGDSVGYFGLEGYYNLPLQGKSGYVGGEKDAAGSPILIGAGRQISAIGGVDLVTSIDKRIQLTLYERLKEGIEKNGAKGGSVAIMDPKTGAIMGMESFPSFDPSKYWQYNDSLFKNPVISDTFEPGSIFKVLVMAAAINEGAVSPDTICDICDGPVKVDKYTIRTWNNEYRPNSTMVDVIVHSDNVGMTFVGQKLGADKLFDYLDKFGIGKPSGIDLQGEGSSLLRKKGTWSNVDLDTASFGQGVAVTGIQMLRAVSAIANGGILNIPKVVKQVRGDGWSQDIIQNQGIKVVSSETAEKIAAMMYEAASKGESQYAYPKGFKIAGKTGTAQIPIEGHYDESKTNASFIGFAPVGDPKFVMLVTINQPQTSPWAAETAAPLWYRIATDLFPYFGIHPEN